jgi:hypothetical protein
LLDNPLRFLNFVGHVIIVSFLNLMKNFHSPENFQIGPQVIHSPMISWPLGSILLRSVGHTIFPLGHGLDIPVMETSGLGSLESSHRTLGNFPLLITMHYRATGRLGVGALCVDTGSLTKTAAFVFLDLSPLSRL